MTITDVRRLWPDVLDVIKELRRFAWVMLSQNAQVASLDDDTLTIALVNVGARDSFLQSGSAEHVQRALHQVLGVRWKIDAVVDPSAQPGPTTPRAEPSAPTASRGVSAPESVREALGTRPDPVDPRAADAAADPDDPVIGSDELDPEQLLSRELGAQVIDEIRPD